MDERHERMVTEVAQICRLAEHADMEGLAKAVRQIRAVEIASAELCAREQVDGETGTLRDVQDRVWPRTLWLSPLTTNTRPPAVRWQQEAAGVTTMREAGLRMSLAMAQERYERHIADARDLFDRIYPARFEDGYELDVWSDPDLTYYVDCARQESRLIQRYRRELRKIEVGGK